MEREAKIDTIKKSKTHTHMESLGLPEEAHTETFRHVSCVYSLLLH